MKSKLKKVMTTLIFAILTIFSSRFLNGTSDVEIQKQIDDVFNKKIFDKYSIVEVDGGNLSGDRRAEAAVDVGYGDREYWAFTNKHSQLVMVIAKKIILQDEKTENVLSNGRYYQDEAYVKGTELKEYDQSHVIADSLGGVANAYNITPQNSFVNRKGAQAEFENRIRNNRGCENFICFITYPNTKTQIPSHYSLIYSINGKIFNHEFENRH